MRLLLGFRRLILRDLPSLREYRVAWEGGLDVRVEDVVVDVKAIAAVCNFPIRVINLHVANYRLPFHIGIHRGVYVMEERLRLYLHEVRVGPRSRVAVNSATRGQHTPRQQFKNSSSYTGTSQPQITWYRLTCVVSQYIADLLLDNLKLINLSP
jgi:hypothetical protein